MKKKSAASGLAKAVMDAVRQPSLGDHTMLPIGEAMDALMADAERVRDGAPMPNSNPAR